jgi:hypothetical protein
MAGVPLDVAEELQAYLIEEGIGVHPNDADGAATIIVNQPRDKAPQPLKDGSAKFGTKLLGDATVTINMIMPARPNAQDFAIDESFIDIIVRARQNAAAKMLLRQIRGLLNPRNSVGGKRMWKMGAIDPVELCLPWRGAQLVGSDENSYDWNESYMFQVRRAILDGETTY